MENLQPDPVRSLRQAQISPMAVLLTGAAVVAAMIIGLTGPRLKDRHGSMQQETPVGELAYTAELEEALMAFEVARGRLMPPESSAAPSGLDADSAALLQAPSVERLALLTRRALGHPLLTPNLTQYGYTLRHARVVELAPGVGALALLYRRTEGSGVVSIFAMPDHGRFVRFDGFGSALPLAPGDEWASAGTAERDTPPRTVYAATDGSTLWLALAPDAATVRTIAPALVSQDLATGAGAAP